MDATPPAHRARSALALLSTAFFCVLALWPRNTENLLGVCGSALSRLMTTAFGHGAWLVPLILLDHTRARILGRQRWQRSCATLAALALACTSLHLVHAHGGRLGGLLGGALLSLLGVGAYLACAAVLLACVARWLSWSPAKALERAVWSFRRRAIAAWRAASVRELEQHRSTPQLMLSDARSAPEPAVLAATATIAYVEALGAESIATPPPLPPRGSGSQMPPLAEPPQAIARHPEPVEVAPPITSSDPEPIVSAPPQSYRLPTPLLLNAPTRTERDLDEHALKATALKLEERLAGYGILGRVDGLTPGPVVTMYEFEPSAGTKLSKIRALVPELSMALEHGVRIIAPLPGTARVGIEVPHAKHEREVVYLRELVDDARWDAFRGTLPLALGKDPSGQPVFADLAAAPHLLVAGATGTGKSSGLNAMLASLLLRRTPAELRLLLIDPKVVELAGFAHIPHLLAPVVTEVREAGRALQWAVGEMERRYQLLAEAGVRNVDAYNARDSASALPSVVIVVDELADLMMADTKEKRVEAAIARLAQKARAAGIHLVLATQRPSVDVITGLIKANLPTRIAYKVAQLVDSKVILDCRGAEQLLGRGDMLCQLPNCSELQRVHCAYVSDDEIKAVCSALRAQGAPTYDASLVSESDGASLSEFGTDDTLYDRAVESVAAAGSCSISALQRALGVGFNKAARIVERMEREGIVGPASQRAGGKRDVLVGAR